MLFKCFHTRNEHFQYRNLDIARSNVDIVEKGKFYEEEVFSSKEFSTNSASHS